MTITPEQANYTHETAEQVGINFIETITHAESLPALAISFGQEIPKDVPAADKLSWLKSFSNEHLDFRNGKERQQVGAVELTEAQADAILATATELGMQGETNATKNKYEFMTILGGANQSNLLRVRHAKQQIDSGVEVPYIVLLGCARKLPDAEKKNVANYAPGAETEFDEINGAFEHEFGVTSSDERTIDMISTGNPGAQEAWKVRSYSLPNGTEVLSVSAPLNEGTGRPNTADTFRFMHEVIGHEMLDSKDVLNITTDLYVFQHPDAIRLLGLPSGANIETIGYGGVDRPASTYGQEINSLFNQAALLEGAYSTSST